MRFGQVPLQPFIDVQMQLMIRYAAPLKTVGRNGAECQKRQRRVYEAQDSNLVIGRYNRDTNWSALSMLRIFSS
jgi:hypothetical protein